MAVLIDSDRCKACALCVAACPQKVLGMGQRINARGYCFACTERPMQCLGCGLCAVICPDAAITVRASGTSYHFFAEAPACPGS